MNEFEYKVITKDDFVRYKLNSMNASSMGKEIITRIVEEWDKIRKGHNFVIAVGKEDDLMFYSVDYFDKNILGEDE